VSVGIMSATAPRTSASTSVSRTSFFANVFMLASFHDVVEKTGHVLTTCRIRRSIRSL
jgi:hypothetical protein